MKGYVVTGLHRKHCWDIYSFFEIGKVSNDLEHLILEVFHEKAHLIDGGNKSGSESRGKELNEGAILLIEKLEVKRQVSLTVDSILNASLSNALCYLAVFATRNLVMVSAGVPTLRTLPIPRFSFFCWPYPLGEGPAGKDQTPKEITIFFARYVLLVIQYIG